MRRTIVLAFLAMLTLNAAQGSETTPGVDAAGWARHAAADLEQLQALASGPRARGAWRQLHALYRECPDCCRNSADEAFGWIPATLLAYHWPLHEELFPLAASDREWFDFVLKSLHGPIDSKLLRRAAANTTKCPVRRQDVCNRIRDNAVEAARVVESRQ